MDETGSGDVIFSHRAPKDGTVRIAYRGEVGRTLKRHRAARFLARIEESVEAGTQLAMEGDGELQAGEREDAQAAVGGPG